MSSVQSRVTKIHHVKRQYSCRICKGVHGLSKCQKFQKMSVEKRLQVVISHNYCTNCLAHKHSSGSCFSSLGCKHCGGNHHSSLHIHQKGHTQIPLHSEKQLRVDRSTSRRKSSSTIPKTLSLESITSPNSTTLFPTAIVEVLHGTKRHPVRAVIDQCTSVSKISYRLVEDLNLPKTTLGEETICPVTIRSRQPPYISVEAMMIVNNRISMDTPKKSLPKSTASKFPNLTLADPQFYKSGPFALVFGADIYSKIIQPGLITSNSGLPVALNTIFGWVLSGSCSA
ncbi:uncharacterized protein LOC142241057 [Haematobia irritans]|uniref:uncharacterized protein LOC142241057 n=1 Tax=Haematobia irritans TaxID=7368 RepID=UPI003F50438C